KIAYRTTHSWFMLIPVGLVAYGIAKDGWWILTISYFSHLLIDLFTHEKEFAQRPLYPVSDFHVEGKNWATNSSVYFFFWALFISAVVVFLQFGGR
ncbi:MAG: hypothetical protein Q7S76_01775, partial [bacterium]|nr:hypothetical protein [bacterium]